MDNYFIKEVPATTEKVFLGRKCDFCDRNSKPSPHPDHVNWGNAGKRRNVDYVSVRRCHGTITDNYDQVTNIEFHMCGLCFDALIYKRFKEMGYKPVERMSGPGKVQQEEKAHVQSAA